MSTDIDSKEWRNLVRETVAEGCTEQEIDLLSYHAKRTDLDPLARQIYMQKRFNKAKNRHDVTIVTSIDGYRIIADRTGQYAGNDDPVFDNEESPRKATVTVYKIIGGVRCPFTASARWDQYYPGDAQGFMWRKMPHLMLGKCAEGLALRKAFPREMGSIYIKEEMEQADRPQDEDGQQKSKPSRGSLFDKGNPEHLEKIEKWLEAKKEIPKEHYQTIVDRLHGRPTGDVGLIVEMLEVF